MTYSGVLLLMQCQGVTVIRVWLLLLLGLVSAGLAAEQSAAKLPCQLKQECVVFGFSPLAKRARAMELMESARIRMNESMPVPVHFKTARNHCRFMARMRNHEFDIVSFPLAWQPYVMKELGYRPIIATDTPYQLMFLSLASKPVDSLDALANKRLGIQLNTLTSKTLLKQLDDMTPALFNAIEFKGSEWEDLIVMDLLRGKVDVMLTAGILYRRLSPDTQALLHTYPIDTDVPLSLLSVSPSLSSALEKRYIASLFDRDFNAKNIFPGLVLRPSNEQDINKVQRSFSSDEPVLNCED